MFWGVVEELRSVLGGGGGVKKCFEGVVEELRSVLGGGGGVKKCFGKWWRS